MMTPNITFRKTILLGLFTFICSSNFCFGQDKTQKIDDLLSLYHEYGKFNGSVLIAEEGKVIYKNGFGMANMEWDMPNEPDTKHRLGSITKQFTGMLIMQLAVEGKLDLQAPISKYLPDYPKANGDKITTHHLLTHTSGIPNYTSFPEFIDEISRNEYAREEFVDLFSDRALDFKPGERFSYSNSGYFLLGFIAEKVAGKSYEELLKEKIFVPLKMNNTGYDWPNDIIKNRAAGYEKVGKDYKNTDYLDQSIPYSAGAMYSTVEDLFIWAQALLTNKLLSEKDMEIYFKPKISAWEGKSYGYGITVGNEPVGNALDSINVFSHGGGINGFNTLLTCSPSDQSTIVLFNNTGQASLNQIASAIRAVMYDKSYDQPTKSIAIDLLDVIEKEGLEAGMKHYDKIKEDDNYGLDEMEVNNAGYQLMGNGKVKEAAAVFKLNIDAFPESFNAYDSYAEALLELGEKEKSIKNYKKSIEMNPGNQNGIDMLEKIGVNTGDLIKKVEISEKVLSSYVGKYNLMEGFDIVISKEGEQLKAQATGQAAFEIYPKSETEFYLKVVEAQIVFDKGKKGKVDSMTLFQGGQELPGKRVE